MKLPRPIRVLIVDDHGLMRAGLRALLSDEPDFDVVGDVASAAETREWFALQTADVVLLDLTLGDETAWSLLSWLKEQKPKPAVLIVSVFREDQFAVHALKNGADGFLNKEADPQLLYIAMRKIASGQRFVSPDFAARLSLGLAGHPQHAHKKLSNREFEVLRLIAQGRSQTSIAEQLAVSPKTISTYRARILEKLHLSSNAEITRYAIEQGLIT